MQNRFKIINTKNLEYNIEFFKSILPNKTKLGAVVKCDAYGHDAVKICQYLKGKVDFFAFSSNLEAINIANKLNNMKMLIIGPFSENGLKKALLKNIIVSVENINQVRILNNYAKNLNKKVKYQLKIDTGMNRLGIRSLKDFALFLKLSKQYKHTKLCGIFSHLGSGESKLCLRSEAQIKNFLQYCKIAPKNIDLHICNTINSINRYSKICNCVRIGIGLYGYGYSNLRPIQSVYAKIVDIKQVKKGQYLGYGSNHISKKNMKIAIVNIGYGQGLPRIWGKKGFFIINCQKAPIIAEICMDMTFVDITNCGKIEVGDYALVMGTEKDLNAETIANACDTIPYEILTNFRGLPTKFSS